MASEPSHEVLVATLNELTHLLILPERLTIGETKLGDGGFGEVCLATLDRLSRSPRKVAVKELRIPLAVRQRVAFRLARELKIWAKVKHPNLLELIGYHLSADCGCAQFVSKYMVNGNVMQYIQLSAASADVRLKFVRDIATGLKYLHDFSPPICHGDLKPANVLVNEGIDAVLCDFGLSSFICETGAATGLTTSKSVKGSTRYMSPELLLEEQSKHALQSDVWAWGCTAFEIMTEKIPYSTRLKDSAVILEIYKKSAPGSIDALDDLILSLAVDHACRIGVYSLRSIIPRCWDFDPQGRPSSSIILHDISPRPRMGGLSKPREEQEGGISSLQIEDRGNASQTVVGSHPVQSKHSEGEPPSSGMCKNCLQRPKFGGHEYCGRTCTDEARRRANNGGGLPAALTSPLCDNGAGRSSSQSPGRSTGGSSDGAMPPAAGSGDNLCKNCLQRPKFGGHEYCGRTCTDEARRRANNGGGLPAALTSPLCDNGAGRSSSQSPGRSTGGSSDGAMPPAAGSGDNLCKNCYMRPKFGTHEYCGRTCAEEAKRKAGGGGLLGSLTSSFWSGGAGDDDGTGRSSSQYPGRSTGSDKHAKKAVQQGDTQPCAYCKEYPANFPNEYCSKECGMRGARERARNVFPLSLITPDKNNYISISRRFQERWDDPILALPEITAIFQINVAKKYMNRFKDAVNAAERLGGSTTKSAFYGGQCICDLGVPQFGTDELCTWGSCSICIVIRKCFDFLEFKLPHHTGDLGNGIYANLNPAKANRFTVQKANYEIRAMILCSIIHLNDLVQGDKNKHSAFIEDTGRVFCANKDVILPRQLILYKDPKPKAGLQPSRAGPGYPFLR